MERHINLHIEKTAGTSVQCLLQEAYGPENVLIYKARSHTFVRGSDYNLDRADPRVDLLKRVFQKTHLMPVVSRINVLVSGNKEVSHIAFDGLRNVDYKAVHGHFTMDMFKGILSSSFNTIVVRDPLERMKSHYMHWQRNHGNTLFRVNVSWNSAVTFADFAENPRLKNYQSQAIADRDLGDFDLVGTTENFDNFFRKLAILITDDNLAGGCVPRLNRTVKRSNNSVLGITSEYIEHFKQTHETDYKMYKEAQILENT